MQRIRSQQVITWLRAGFKDRSFRNISGLVPNTYFRVDQSPPTPAKLSRVELMILPALGNVCGSLTGEHHAVHYKASVH